VNVCVGGEAVYTERCGSQCWACLNDALYSVTHPSKTSNVGPTASIFSRYVDLVSVGQWVVLLESDGRLFVEVFNNQQDMNSLIISYTGNVSVAVYGTLLQQETSKAPHCSLGNTRPGQKLPGLRSECAVRRHRAAQGRTVKQNFYLGAMTRVRDAVRCNDQEMAVCLVVNHNAPIHLAHLLQPMFAEQHIQ